MLVQRANPFLFVLALALLGGGTLQAGGVKGTKHDFSGAPWSGGQVCAPCHAPHQTNSRVGYLWNHAIGTDADFTKRSGATLSAESLTCLGCHDGQTAIDSFGGRAGGTMVSGEAIIGRDLTNDHPVGVAYVGGGSWAPIGVLSGSQPGVVVGSGGLPLWGSTNQIECATCHDPHNNGFRNFLRMSNNGSAMCLACHVSKA